MMNSNTKESYDLEHPRITDSVGKRLAEFTAYTGMNPDALANLVLTQWMDAQLAMFASTWGLDPKNDKYRRMAGK